MVSSNRLFLTASLGNILSMIGLAWDAHIHIVEHGTLLLEPLLNLSEPMATNPGHLVFGAGFLLAVASCLLGFADTWMRLHRTAGKTVIWQTLAFPLAVSVLTAGAGLTAVIFLGQTG